LRLTGKRDYALVIPIPAPDYAAAWRPEITDLVKVKGIEALLG